MKKIGVLFEIIVICIMLTACKNSTSTVENQTEKKAAVMTEESEITEVVETESTETESTESTETESTETEITESVETESSVVKTTTETEKNKQEDVKSEEMVIDTPIMELKYPSKWENQIRVEIQGENGYNIKFLGAVEGKEEQHLFDISFGGDGEIPLGSVVVDEVGYDVCFTFAELEIDDWDEDDKNQIYAMQEDVNYLIEQLEKADNFEVAE